MDKKTIIFDFDGTIADSLEKTIETFNELSEEYGFKRVYFDEIVQFKKLTPVQILEKFDISKWKLPILLKKGKDLFNSKITSIRPFDGMKEILEELKANEFIIGILSSNSKENIELFLKNNNINSISFIHCESNLFGKSKAIKKVLQEQNLKMEEAIYVGDEVRDIEACKKCNIECIAVTWGFNDKEILEKYSPNHLIDKPEQLLNILKI
jgi:phosphoglycolate phosphatase-like HAD superfamily hydrolase